MEDDEVFLFVPPDAFALDQECAALGHEGNKTRAIHGARVDDCWPPGGGGSGGWGRAAATLLTLLMPVAPLSAFWLCSWRHVRTCRGMPGCLRLVQASATALAWP